MKMKKITFRFFAALSAASILIPQSIIGMPDITPDTIREALIGMPTGYYMKVTDYRGEILKNGFHRFDFDGAVEVKRFLGDQYERTCLLSSLSTDLYKIRLYLKSDGLFVTEIFTSEINDKTLYMFGCSSDVETTLLIDFK